jgi:hypothetical protein
LLYSFLYLTPSPELRERDGVRVTFGSNGNGWQIALLLHFGALRDSKILELDNPPLSGILIAFYLVLI